MKLISLNTYGGTLFEAIIAFVEEHKADTDVFCFQEIITSERQDLVTTIGGNRAHFMEELIEYLPDFQSLFSGMIYNVDTSFLAVPGIVTGLAIFVKKSLPVTNYTTFFVHGTPKNNVTDAKDTSVGAVQIFELNVGGQTLTLCNAHGAYLPADKRDSSGRLAQSQKMLNAMSDRHGEKIIVGDFNLFPDTESIHMFEQAGYRNLVVEYNIPTTRGSMNKQLHPEFAHGKYGFQEFADYTFITSGLKVKTFEVPDLPLSDHLPMILEIE